MASRHAREELPPSSARPRCPLATAPIIAGLYGINVDPDVSPYNVPELEWCFGYLYALALMAAVAFGLLGLFYRRGWIGARRNRTDDGGAGDPPR